MAISIICSNCNASYSVPQHLAGKTVTCKHCSALLDVPGGFGYRAPVVSGETSYQRVVGKPNPLALEIMGINPRMDGELGAREIFRLLWSLRHVALLILLLVLWSRYAADNLSAEYAAPVFFLAGIVLIIGGWIQLMTISRNLAANIGTAKSSLLPYVASSFVLIATDFRASLPALRTMFLGLLTFIASLSLASQAGGLSHVFPLHLIPSFKTQDKPSIEPGPLPTGTFETPTTKSSKPPPPPPPPPPLEDKPLPPPEDVLPPPN